MGALQMKGTWEQRHAAVASTRDSSKTVRTLCLGLGILALVVLAMVAVAGQAEATHYRYGTLSWEPTENGSEVRFTGDSAWRHSYPAFNEPELGEILNISDVDASVDPIETGDGETIPFQVEVVAINEERDWFYGVLTDDDGTRGIPHEYEAPNDDGEPWRADWTGCCRITDRHEGNYHVNNPDQSMRMETLVDLMASEEGSPETSLPPINQCRIDAVCSIQVPAVHPAGMDISFRESTPTEAGDSSYVRPGPPHAPHESSIGTDNGTIHWNTTGAEHDPDFDNWDTLYSMQVMLEDEDTKVPLDFLIEIVPEDTEFPYWTDDTTVCETTQNVDVGETLSFNVTAASDDEARLIELDHLGLPEGATFPRPDPANPVTGTFTWEPTTDQGGSYLVIFTAVDDEGAQAPPCPVTIEVEDYAPEFLAPTPCVTGEPVLGAQGVPLSFPIKAQSPLPDEQIVSFTVVDGPGQATIEAPDNPAQGEWTWDSPTVGHYIVAIQAEDERGVTATCKQPVAIQEPAGQSLVTSLWSGTSVPASLEYRTKSVDQRQNGEQTARHATLDPEQGDAYAEGIVENASVTLQGETANATGSVTIVSATLLGGLVEIEGLTHEASLTWDLEQAQLVHQETTFEIDRLTVAGEEVPVAYEGEPVTVPLPHGGVLTLFNSTVHVSDDRADHVGQLAHAYSPLDYTRTETILGSVVLGVGGTPSLETGGTFEYRSQPRMIHEEDDDRTGGDVGDHPHDAEPIQPGIHDASLPPGDTTDYYAIDLEHGEKINLVLQPAPRATATGGDVHADGDPPPGVEAPSLYVSPFEFWSMRLLDPTLTERELSDVFVTGSTERIEFNADVNGTWFIEVNRDSTRAEPTEAYNYTLGATVTPVPLLPQNEAAPWADAPSACDPSDDEIPKLHSGVWPGTFQHEDVADVYRFDARIGEVINVALKPGETLDGANMALVLYDEDCQELVRSSWYTGTHPYFPKGLPELTPQLPSQYTGEYFIGVERVNGVGNYYLSLTVANPMPTLPENDAFTGQDAASTCDSATMSPAPLYQGRLHDGDEGDAYKVPYQAGYDAYLVLEMSATSTVHVTLTTPSGDTISPDVNLLDGTWVFDFDAPETGDYCLSILPDHGGGNYMVSHGERPPLPALPSPADPLGTAPGS